MIGRDTRCTPHRNLDRTVSEYVFYIITEGDMFFSEDGIEYHLKKGDCFLFEPDKHQCGLKNSNYQLIYIHFQVPNIICEDVSDEEFKTIVVEENSQWLSCNENGYFPTEYISILKIGRINNEATLKRLSKMADSSFEESCVRLEHYNVLRACDTTKILVEVYRAQVSEMLDIMYKKSVKPYKVVEIVKYIQVNYNRKLTGDIVERELMYNFDYINQLLKNYLNTSFFKLLERTRIEMAIHFLRTSDATVEYIANEVGYADSSYFYKVFKKNMGVSPIEYKKKELP
mgnify:CR=1 FL=1